jgi:flagellar basal-body rod protein FlgC
MVDTTNPASSTISSIAASALRAQQSRMRIIAENIANSDSTSRTPGGDPYRRQVAVFTPSTVQGGGEGVNVARIQPDASDFKMEYAPGHPGADAKGYLKMPNVDPLIETLDMREAQRAYEANLSVIETARAMQMRTLDLLKK